jgi:hypothetical protein
MDGITRIGLLLQIRNHLCTHTLNAFEKPPQIYTLSEEKHCKSEHVFRDVFMLCERW